MGKTSHGASFLYLNAIFESSPFHAHCAGTFSGIKFASKSEAISRKLRRKMPCETSDTPTATYRMLFEASDASTSIDKVPSEASDCFTATDIMPSEAFDCFTTTDKVPSEASACFTAIDKVPSETSDCFVATDKVPSEVSDSLTAFTKYKFGTTNYFTALQKGSAEANRSFRHGYLLLNDWASVLDGTLVVEPVETTAGY
ncbi:MAG: hypothetical protein J1E59_04830 [Treponema sp.]|nr:hypothetical protein [Treponema sp.]